MAHFQCFYLKEALMKATPALSERAAPETRFAACGKINRLPRSILPAHPCAGGRSEFLPSFIYLVFQYLSNFCRYFDIIQFYILM